MAALLYFATAGVLLWLAARFVTPLSRGAALALLLLPLCFTGRALLTGRVYAPVEMPYAAQPLSDLKAKMPVPPIHNGILSDIAYEQIPWREAVRRSLRDREWPLLDRFVLCGDVLAGAAQPAPFSPFTLIACILPAAMSFTFTGSIAFFVAALGAFLFARELACSEAASVVAAIAWSFSAAIALLILWPLGFTWALLPFLLMAVRRRSIPILTVAIALEILAGHPETLLHVFAIAAAYGLFERSRLRTMRVAAIAGVLALLITAIATLPFLDAYRNSGEARLRSDIYAKLPLRVEAGFPRAALLSDLFPFLRPRFPQIAFERSDAGGIVLALAICGLLFVRRREAWFFAILCAITLLAGAKAWPVAQLLHRIPLFDRALNERLAVAVPLCLAVLAAFAVDALERRTAMVMVALSAAIAVAAFVFQTSAAAELLPLAIAAVAVFFHRREILIGAILLNRVMADGAIVPVQPASLAFPPLQLFAPLQKIDEPFRIAGRGTKLLPNTATMWGLEDVRGSTPIRLARLTETYPLWLTQTPMAFDSVEDLKRPFLAMMNVRFALLDVSDPIPPGWRDFSYDIWTRIIENPASLPRAFVPRHLRIGVPPDREVEEMSRETDFARRAWLQIAEPLHERENGPGEVHGRWHGSELLFDATMQSDGFVVVTEAAWPGWRAYVDGRRTRTVIANHAFLAIPVTSGRHAIRLRFLPQSFVIGRAVTLATLLLIAAYCLFKREHPVRSSA